MRVLLTGGAGFIGSVIAGQLLARGHDVRVLDVLLPEAHPSGEPPHLPDGVRFVRGDVRDRQTVAAALHDVDAVSHQAAMVGLGVRLDDLPLYASCNDLGTAVLLAELGRAGVRRLVLAGSMVIYGEGRYRCARHGMVAAPPRRAADLAAGRFEPACRHCGAGLTPALVPESTPADPRNAYAVSKLAQEHYAQVWARETASGLSVLRYHNVYGPGMPRDTPYAGVAAIFRSSLARGEAPRVFEDGGQRRDFISVHDVASANVAALEATQPGAVHTWNVGTGEPRTVLQMAQALSLALDGPAPVVTGEFRLGDVRHITADSDLIRAELGWKPEVAFDDGMAEFARA